MKKITIIREQIKDYLHFLKQAYYIFDNIDESESVKKQIINIYIYFKKHLNEKKINRKKVNQLKWYLDCINTFDKIRIYNQGKQLLENGN